MGIGGDSKLWGNGPSMRPSTTRILLYISERDPDGKGEGKERDEGKEYIKGERHSGVDGEDTADGGIVHKEEECVHEVLKQQEDVQGQRVS